MCGIAGFLFRDGNRDHARSLVTQMTQALHHRGPDHSGVYIDDPIALGHARLSIIDLSPEANQPMLLDDGEYAVVFNGEIYNFRQLAQDLRRDGVVLRTRSDTEVMLALYKRRGLEFLQALRGMFALAIWDRRQRRLLLARDRVGKKPLFYFAGPTGLSFASELSALLADPHLVPQVDPQALHLYLSLGYVPSNFCMIRGVSKVAPGSYVLVEQERMVAERYYRLKFRPQQISAKDAADELRRLLTEAISLRMISDVPLGAFLSGGIDSSAVVALMAQLSNRPVKTFSIGFEDQDFSEVAFARKVAARFHTEHHEEVLRVSAAALLPELVRCYSEPFADPSAIPTYLLSKMTRQHVTVALSGDGGDEAFAGYTRYAHERNARIFQRLPKTFALPLARAVERHFPGRGKGRLAELGAAVRHHAERLQVPDLARYRLQFEHFAPAQLEALYSPELRGAVHLEAEDLFQQVLDRSSATHPVDRLLDIDTNTYLPDNIFVKVDLASMAHALEVRSPFVDHYVLEFAASLPPELKLFGYRGKRVLRLAMEGLLPASVIHRRKRGFSIPHSRWLRGDLASLARETLLGTRASARGYFDRAYVHRLLDEHQRGSHNHGLRIWNLLWLELWHQEFVDQTVARTSH